MAKGIYVTSHAEFNALQARLDRAEKVCKALKDVRSTLTDTDVEWMMPDVLQAHDLYLASKEKGDE